jgi:hypothetical protein
MSADIASKLNTDNAAETAPLFVINLCASTSPMALTHPNTPELKRYTFFVSRQREDGRERFRLHMGYFASQEEAESLLATVRDVYPAAWAGPAPTSGVPRRARPIGAAPTIVSAAAVIAAPAASPPSALPPQVAAPPVMAPAVVAPAVAPSAAAQPVAVAPPRMAAPMAAAKTSGAKDAPVLEAMSNVRNVLAQLDGSVRTAPAVAARPEASAPAVKPTAVASAAAPASAPTIVPPAPVVQARPATPVRSELNASQTLQVLEAATPVASVDVEEDLPEVSDVRVVTPEDTQTLRDIDLDAKNNAPPCFAVQLVWAVSPIDVASLPHLAIFDAYTLYNVEGSRQGRKWYGLRLGFFSDPNSATQVAHYVRSDYQAVAVVPVAIKERDNARGGTKSAVAVAPRLGDAGAPQKPRDELALQVGGLDGFELLQDDRPPPEKRDVDDIGARAAAPRVPAANVPAPKVQAPNTPVPKLARDRIAAAAAANTAARAAAAPVNGKPAGKPTGKRVVVRKRPQPSRAAPGAPQPLESTLEILGASTLTLDNSREIVNDSAIREPIEKKQASRFSKLLNRLSGG